jgi:VanZ family protein
MLPCSQIVDQSVKQESTSREACQSLGKHVMIVDSDQARSRFLEKVTMPSTIAPTSILEERSSMDAFLNPWNWIALIFAVQSLGALITVHLFELSFTQVASPIVFLILGFFVAIAFRWYDSSSRLGLWKWWVPALIYALVVFLLSNRSYPDARPLVDPKLFHFAEYLTLGIFLAGASHGLLKQIGTPGFALFVQTLGTVYAFSDEFHQALIPGRTSTLTDVLIDAASVALGLGVFLLARFMYRTQEKRRTLLPASPQ